MKLHLDIAIPLQVFYLRISKYLKVVITADQDKSISYDMNHVFQSFQTWLERGNISTWIIVRQAQWRGYRPKGMFWHHNSVFILIRYQPGDMSFLNELAAKIPKGLGHARNEVIGMWVVLAKRKGFKILWKVSGIPIVRYHCYHEPITQGHIVRPPWRSGWASARRIKAADQRRSPIS